LIDAQGYIRLTDFGLSKMDMKESNATSICGTPEYLAPEVLYKQGHGKPVDWWCLGSVIYEMVVGLPPFYSKSRTELFDKIKFANPSIPAFISTKLRNLFECLFQKKPENRLGSKEGANEVKNHPWFQGVDWGAILKKKQKAPFVPNIKSEIDVSNFDPEFTECDVESYNEASTKSHDDGKPFYGILLLI
jgi:serum/glucocorticoid-regulated kinase 2